MNTTLLYRKLLPGKIREKIYSLFLGTMLEYKRNWQKSRTIIKTYNSSDLLQLDKKKYISYLKRNQFWMSKVKMIFLSKFVNKYLRKKVIVNLCPDTGLHYILHEGKKLYWRRGVDPEKIVKNYQFLLAEQDDASPHQYWKDKSTYINKSFFDVGASEGLITLNHVDLIRHAYLFECDVLWIEALSETFKPYKDKITIVEKYVSDKTDELNNTISLDYFVLKNKCEIDLIKFDIEGYEERALTGCVNILSQKKDLDIAICVYHKASSEVEISETLLNTGFDCKINPGYMYFPLDETLPYLRHGVLKAQKRANSVNYEVK